MNRTELVDRIADSAGISKAAANNALDAFTETVIDAMKKSDEIVLVGFGSFKVNKRAARTGRNPKTGETITIKAANVVKFKAGKKLKDAVSDTAAV